MRCPLLGGFLIPPVLPVVADCLPSGKAYQIIIKGFINHSFRFTDFMVNRAWGHTLFKAFCLVIFKISRFNIINSRITKNSIELFKTDFYGII